MLFLDFKALVGRRKTSESPLGWPARVTSPFPPSLPGSASHRPEWRLRAQVLSDKQGPTRLLAAEEALQMGELPDVRH